MRRFFVSIGKLFLVFMLVINQFIGCETGFNELTNVDGIIIEEMNEVTLKFYFPGLNPQINNSRVIDKIEVMSKQELNIKLDFKWIEWDNYYDRIKELVNSQDSFDGLYTTSQMWNQYNFAQMLEDDILLDISEMFQENAPNLFGKFTSKELIEASYEGKLYAIPNLMPQSLRMCVVAREDLIKKHGITEINTYEDYEDFLEIIKEKEKEIIPGNCGGWTEIYFAESFGYADICDYLHMVYRWDDPEMKLVPWEQTLEYRKTYEMLRRWHENGYIDNDADIGKGNTASVVTNWFFAQEYIHVRNGEYELKAYPLYKEKTAQKGSALTCAIGFNKYAENPERAIKFIEWIQSSQRNYDVFMYGIEGENFMLINERLSLPDENIRYVGWYGSDSFMNFDYVRELVTDNLNFKQSWKESLELNTEYPPHLGFIPDFGSIKVIANKRERSYKKMEREQLDGNFITDVNDFIKEQKTNGVDQMVYEMQLQLDKWRESRR